jgi:D-alanyl-D-alanine carboxypeptidase (penicillin-binding protein 5/6)
LRAKILFSFLAVALVWTPATASAADRPDVVARSAILVDASDGHVLFRRDARTRRPIASVTKLMTALLTVERLPLERRLRAGRYSGTPAESTLGLVPGERMSVADLLRALLLASANDAAVTLARGAGGSVEEFVSLMNSKAQQLGLTHTHYANPVGLDEVGNYSSARDLATLARVVLRNGFIAETVDTPRARLLTGAHPRIVANRNDLVGRVPWVDGVKTGHTSQAGYVLVGAGRRAGAQLVSVVLGTPSESARDTDTLALLDYGLAQYRRVFALRRGRPVAEAKVAFFGDRKVGVEPARTVAVSVRRGERVRTRIDAPGELHGPLAEATTVGHATVFVDGQRVRTIPLVTAGAVPKAGILRKLVHWFLWPFIVLALAAAAVMAIGRRRRRLAAADAARRRRRQARREDQREGTAP